MASGVHEACTDGWPLKKEMDEADMGANSFVVDVTEATFGREVIERSKQVPVLVDFWAAWCGPCRMLSPTLEKLASEFEGAFVLAKVDTDQNQRLAQQYRIQGIPAVKAFRNGQVVNEFVGAQPEARVREFLRVVLPNEADRWAARGATAEGQQDLATARMAYQQALELQPDQPLALLGLGRVSLAEAQYDDAIEFFSRVPPASPQGEEARQLIVQARVRAESAALGQEDDLLTTQASAPPGSPAWLDAQLALGKLRVAQGDTAAGLDLLLEVVRRDRSYQDGAARKTMVDVFALLGDQDPLTMTYRRRLSSLLF